MKTKFFLFFYLFAIISFAQVLTRPLETVNGKKLTEQRNDSILDKSSDNRPADSLNIYNPKISDYNYWTSSYPKQTVDTILSMDNYYKQNVYQKDLFAYQQFPNLGQTLQALEPDFDGDRLQLLPTGKSYLYIQEKDVKYFDVKTPLTEFIFENGVEEGQYLSTTFAHNVHSRWNYAINYRYLKSQGRYLNSLVNSSNIVLSSNYKTTNNRYQLQANFVAQDFNNQENGGLTQESLNNFIQDNPNFSNRERMYINLENAQTKYDERRVHLSHQFGLLSFGKKLDSLSVIDSTQKKSFPIYLKHTFEYKHQAFQYEENAPENYYSSNVLAEDRRNRKKLDRMDNYISLGYKWSDRLDVEAGLLHQMIELYYDESQMVNLITVPESVKENRLGLQGQLKFDWRKNIHITADASVTKGDELGDAYHLNAQARIIPFKNYLLEGGVELRSSFPSLNYYNNQSFYADFNYHNTQFKNETFQRLYASLSSQQLGLTIFGAVINNNHLVYIDQDYMPKQAEDALNYFKLGAREHYKYKKFGVDVQAQFQKVIENDGLLPLPNVLARATLYYDTWAFKNHAHIQTGITSSFYSKFKAREFFSVLNEFMLSNEQKEIGNYPKTDIFFNIKVDRMRIYLRGENINSFFQKGEYFSSPLHPARDFKIQLGIHWFLFT